MKGLNWVLFHLLIFFLLALDLGVFRKKSKEITIQIALYWSLFWISIALLFNLVIFLTQGRDAALSFLTAYVIEKSLSIDNIFVFLGIFSFLKISGKYQHKILYFGILGAMILRGIFIFSGLALLEHFSWMIYVFGGILIVTGLKMGFQKKDSFHPKQNRLIFLLERWFPLKMNYSGSQFFIREENHHFATPLMVALILVESADVIFAFDSIPAVLSVSPDPFIVYTSNIFAILGLRSLYFALAQLATHIRYLHYGLSVILVFVGTKMASEEVFPISTGTSLAVIGTILAVTVLASNLSGRTPSGKGKTRRQRAISGK